MDQRGSHCPEPRLREPPASGTGEGRPAGQEDPFELDSSPGLWDAPAERRAGRAEKLLCWCVWQTDRERGKRRVRSCRKVRGAAGGHVHAHGRVFLVQRDARVCRTAPLGGRRGRPLRRGQQSSQEAPEAVQGGCVTLPEGGGRGHTGEGRREGAEGRVDGALQGTRGQPPRIPRALRSLLWPPAPPCPRCSQARTPHPGQPPERAVYTGTERVTKESQAVLS
eukprot:XP_001709671.1 Hypothetical protein GL50803_21184 [Giardia lamblia ATCC 50803]